MAASMVEEGVNFGDLPAEVDALLQRGVIAHRHDRGAAESLFQQALALSPEQLPVYFCLYKIHTYGGRLRDALTVATAGLSEAARQAGWSEDVRRWPRPAPAPEGAARFALYTLKALAFIHLKLGDRTAAGAALDALAGVDPEGRVGWRVVAELAQGS
jgi:hypothetical protein